MNNMPLFLKRISILVFLVIFSCEDDPSINLVKNGTFNAYPNQLIGEAVEKVMSNPKWESGIGIEGETKGKTLVNINFSNDKETHKFKLKSLRNINRKSINILRNKEISLNID